MWAKEWVNLGEANRIPGCLPRDYGARLRHSLQGKDI